jgi:hypothetical protein
LHPARQGSQPSRELLVVLMLLKCGPPAARTEDASDEESLSSGASLKAGVGVEGAAGSTAAEQPSPSAAYAASGASGSDATCSGERPSPADIQSGAGDTWQRIPMGDHPGGDAPAAALLLSQMACITT